MAVLPETDSRSGFGGLRGGMVADEEESNVIRLAGPAREIFDRVNDSLLQLIERSIVLAGENFA